MNDGMRAVLASIVWTVIGSAHGLGDTPELCFYCPFDQSYDAIIAAGDRRALYQDRSFVRGRHGYAVYVGPAPEAGEDQHAYAAPFYSSRGNLPKARGSMEMWVRPDWDAGGDVQRCFFHEDAPYEAGQNAIWLWQFRGDTLRFDVRDPAATALTADIGNWERGEWHHLVATWDCAAGASLYVDGDLRDSAEFTWEPLEYDQFNLGARPYRTGEMEAALDEFKLYTRRLTAEEVKQAFAGRLPMRASPASRVARTEFVGGRAELVGEVKHPVGSVDVRLPADRGALTLWAKAGWRGGDGIEGDVLRQIDASGGGGGFRLRRARRPAALRLERGDFRPAAAEIAIDRSWRVPQWHHIAVCWRNGRGALMYLDGLPVPRARLEGYDDVRWTARDMAQVWVGGPGTPGGAEVRGLRVFDRPLLPEQVWEELGGRAVPRVRAVAGGEADLWLLNPTSRVLRGTFRWHASGSRGKRRAVLAPGEQRKMALLGGSVRNTSLVRWDWRGALSRRSAEAYRLSASGARPLVPVIDDTVFLELQDELLDDRASLAAGADNPCNVLWKGDVVRFPQRGRRPTLNALHPTVWEALVGRVREVAALHADDPCFRGVAFELHSGFAGWLGDSQGSFDAWSLGEFARVTGHSEVAPPRDAWEVNRAYLWLRETAWDEWLDWRARTLTERYLELADRIAGVRTGAKLHLVCSTDLTADAAREGGLELDPLQASPNVVIDFPE